MNQKEFMNKVEELLSSMSKDDLKNCLYELARRSEVHEMYDFLRLIYDFNKNDSSGRDNLMSDDYVEEKMEYFRNNFLDIEEGELSLSSTGYEDHSSGYWSRDWITEYEDNEGVGSIIKEAVSFAYDLMNDYRYKEALTLFDLVTESSVLAVDEDSGDDVYLSFQEMVEEGLISINLNTLAGSILYTAYQAFTPEERAEEMFKYFDFDFLKKIQIEDIFRMGKQELKDTDLFMESWITMLQNKKGDIPARLLKEALLYHEGIKGLDRMAREGYKEHPSVFLAVIKEHEKNSDYEEIVNIGFEALEKLDKNLIIRGQIALETAKACYLLKDTDKAGRCIYEAFYSDTGIRAFLEIFKNSDITEKYVDLMIEHVDEVPVLKNTYQNEASELMKNGISDFQYKCLKFFSGEFEDVYGWITEQKNPLGWSGSFIGQGIDLMLMFLHKGTNYGKAMNQIAQSCLNHLESNDYMSYVSFSDDLSEIQEFKDLFNKWRSYHVLSDEIISSYVKSIEKIIDKRIDAIVTGKFNSRYSATALLAAALGEVKESLGEKGAKYSLIMQYMNKYPRHRSFRGSLQSYI